jgi:hypothetical protein
MDPRLAAALGVIAGLILGYLASYLAQKGKNAAMAQDIDELTEITKSIEGKI